MLQPATLSGAMELQITLRARARTAVPAYERTPNQSMKPKTPHNNKTRMKKSEDTPVEKCSKARRVPTETGFKL
jgi:hypothetical protein